MSKLLFITANEHEKDAFLEKFEPDGEFISVDGAKCSSGKFALYDAFHLHLYSQGTSAPDSTPLVEKAIKHPSINPDAVIAVGIAFGADSCTQKIGDVLVSNYILPYDSQKVVNGKTIYKDPPKEAGYKLKNAFNHFSEEWFSCSDGTQKTFHVFNGYLLSGAKLVNDKELRDKLMFDFKDYDPIGGEMEATGIYSVCKATNKEWIIVKGICDWGFNKSNPNKEHDQITAATAAVDLCHYVFSRVDIFDDIVINNDNSTIISWGDAPPHMEIFGRNNEMGQLETDKENGAKIFCFQGPGGIGKSTLARNWTDANLENCYAVAWISFKNRPEINNLFKDLHQILMPSITVPMKKVDGHIKDILNIIRDKKVIIIFDNLESVMQTRENTGKMRAEYELIENFVTRFADQQTNSTIILTTRELPDFISELHNSMPKVCLPKGLEGLPLEVMPDFVKAQGLIYHSTQKLDLFAVHYGRSPYAIKVTAPRIIEEYGGIIDRYVDAGCALPSRIMELLDTQVSHLTDLQCMILFRLAVERIPIALTDIQSAFRYRYSNSEIKNAIEQLSKKSLIEPPTESGLYFIQNVLIDYATDKICAIMSENILKIVKSKDISDVGIMLRDLPLINAMASREVRAAQVRTLVKPIFEAINDGFFGNRARLKEELYNTARSLGNDIRSVGYAVGTFVNLMLQCENNLNGLDFSNSCLWSCDFEYTDLIDTNFYGSDLRFSRFREVLSTVNAITFGKTSQEIYFGTSDGMVHYQNITLQQHCAKRVHSGYVRDIVYSKQLNVVITVGEDRTLHVLDPIDLQDRSEVIIENESLRFVAVSDNGENIIWGGEGGLIVRRNDNGIQREYSVKKDIIRDCCFIDDNTIAFVTETGYISLGTFNSALSKFVYVSLPEEPLWCVTKCDDCIAVAGKQGIIHMFNRELEEIGPRFENSNSPVWKIVDGKRYFIASVSGGDILFFDKLKGNIQYRIQAHDNWVRAMAIDNSQQYIASGSADQSVCVYNQTTRELIFDLEGESVDFLSVIDTGKFIATGGTDGLLHCWNGDIVKRIHRPNSSWIRAMTYSEKFKTAIVGYGDGRIETWDLETDTFKLLGIHSGGDVWSLDWHPNKTALLSASEDGKVLEWKKDFVGNWSHKEVYNFGRWAISVRYSPDGNRIACGDGLGKVVIIDGDNKTELPVFENSDQAWGIAWSKDGSRLVVAERSSLVRIWNVVESKPQLVSSFSTKEANWAAATMQKTDEMVIVGDSGVITLLDGDKMRQINTKEGRIRSIAVSPHDNTFIIAGYNGMVLRIFNESGATKHYVPNKQYSRLNICNSDNLSDLQVASIVQFGGKAV